MEHRITNTFDNQSIAFKNKFISKADLSQSISTSNATLMSNINTKFEKFKQHQQETNCHIKHATTHFSVLDNQHKQLKEKLHIHREDINQLNTSMTTLNTSFTSKQQKLEEEIAKATSFASTTPTNLSADLESEILDDITDLKTITNTIKADVDKLKITMTPLSKISQTHNNSLFPSSPQVSTPSTANLDIINHQEMKIKDQADTIKALTEQMQSHQHTIDLCYQRIGQQKNIDPTIANPNTITEKYPILKPTKLKLHQSIFQAQLEHIIYKMTLSLQLNNSGTT
jgi:chromosome segregation ATPase